MDLPLSDGTFTQIDESDYDLVKGFTWSRFKTGRPGLFYATHTLPRTSDGTPRKKLRLHRFILGLTPGDPEVDHIDHDGLNNQRSNLRLATRSQNGGNRRPNNGTKFRGVSWNARDRRWQVFIYQDGKQRALGYFHDPAEGARVYDAAAREVWGDFAYQNFPGVT